MLSSGFTWVHVPGVLNPADVFSRGVNPEEFINKYAHVLEGPENLHRKDPFMLKDTKIIKKTEEEISTLKIDTYRPYEINCTSFHDLLIAMVNLKLG